MRDTFPNGTGDFELRLSQWVILVLDSFSLAVALVGLACWDDHSAA